MDVRTRLHWNTEAPAAPHQGGAVIEVVSIRAAGRAVQ
jgi:hypothetical protein